VDFGGPNGLGFGPRQEARTDHGFQDRGSPLVSAVQMIERGKPFGHLDHARDHGAFGRFQFPNVFAKKNVGGRLHAVRSLAQINLVQVHGEDLVLGVNGLDLSRDQPLAELAGDPFLAGQQLGK